MALQTIKKGIKAFDLFAQPITFRYGEEPMYQSVTGGVFSIALIIVFAVIFTNTVINTFKRENISSIITSIQQQDPTYYKVGTDQFMFAVGFNGISMKSSTQWFNIYIQKVTQSGTYKVKQSLHLQSCQRQQWIKINKDFNNIYDRLALDSWLCPTNGTLIELQGKYSSDMFKYIKIGVSQCTAASLAAWNQTTCATPAQITNYTNINQAFQLNFYFINTIINPNNKNYTQLYLDDTNYFPFTTANGISANFFLSSYQIDTDESIYPVVDTNTLKGGISNVPTQIINYQYTSGDFVKLYIRKSSLSLSIQRSFQKIDDTLSYIGGLFSTLIVVLALLSIYNEYCYELEVAQNLYHYEKNVPIKSHEFNFLIYLGYLIYVLFDKIGVDLPWKRMRMYHYSLQEVRKQMDIRLIMKKILYSQRMAIAVFDEPKAKILHLQQPLTLQQAQQIRKDHRFYQKLEEKYFDYDKIHQEQQSIKKQETKDFSLLKKQSKTFFEGEFQAQQNIEPSPQKNFKHSPSPIDSLGPVYGLNRKVLPRIINNKVRDEQPVIDNGTIQTQTNQQQKIGGQASILNILNMFINEEARKQRQLEQMIEKMKQYVKILQKQAKSGDVVSQNILNRFDPKLKKMFIQKQPDKQQSKQEQTPPPFNLFGALLNLNKKGNSGSDDNLPQNQ